MTIQDIKNLIDETVQLIAVNRQSMSEAGSRASRFLVVNAALNNFLQELEEELPKYKTLVNARYAEAMRAVPGKIITEKKVEAEANVEYSKVREEFEQLDSMRDWIKNHMRIFENAHIMFRQYTRE